MADNNNNTLHFSSSPSPSSPPSWSHIQKKKRLSTSHFCCCLQLLTFMTCSYKSSCLQELQGAASLMGWIPRHGISTFLSKRGSNWSYPSCAALSDPQRYVSLVRIDASEASLLLILNCSSRKLARTMV